MCGIPLMSKSIILIIYSMLTPYTIYTAHPCISCLSCLSCICCYYHYNCISLSQLMIYLQLYTMNHIHFNKLITNSVIIYDPKYNLRHCSHGRLYFIAYCHSTMSILVTYMLTTSLNQICEH